VNYKGLIQNFCPPVLLKLVRQFRKKNNIYFTGNYASWAEAEMCASGYDADTIFQRVHEATLKVVRGEAVFERDSVCFYKEDYRWPALACLLSIAAEKNGHLNVLDFGGALGSFYFQHKKFFSRLKSIRWSVIEQAHFVECGQRELQNDKLRFYANIAECIDNEKVDVVFLSSVLQYLDNPTSMLIELSEIKADFILIDRTPFIEDLNDRLTVQSVPKSIYKASYPAWFFSNQQFNTLINTIGYRTIEELDCDDDVGVGKFKGYFLARI
jgi:putative methyltransferase (TIGR04325 family)